MLLLGSSPLSAGLYNTAEPEPDVWPSADFRRFHASFMDLRSITIEMPQSQLRKRYLLVGKVDLSGRSGSPTVEQQLNLGAYLIRLKRSDEAVAVLTQAAGRDRTNFMVLSNLATAYQLTDNLTRAIDYQEQSLKNWPTTWAGIGDGQLQRYHAAEKYYLRLIRLRYQEMVRQPPGRQRLSETIDDLFDVRFIGDSGRFEPGKLAANQRAKLPENALAIVEQLLIWLPEDMRLYWLFGEVLNARGDVRAAAQVFDELVWNYRFSAAELQQHRQLLQELKSGPAEPSWAAGAPEQPPAHAPPSAETTASDTTRLLTAAGVGAIAGMLIAGLAYLQFRDIRGRGRAAVKR